MQLKSQKTFTMVALIGIFGAYFWYMLNKSESTTTPNFPEESKSLQIDKPRNYNDKKDIADLPIKRNAQPDSPASLLIEDIQLIDINSLEIDEFRDLRDIFDELGIPPAVMMFIQNGDLVSASSILLSEPNNPKLHLALELISITCSAMSYEEKFLQTDVAQQNDDSKGLTKKEHSFFNELSHKRLEKVQYFNQSCNDFKQAEIINIEEKRNKLQATNESPMAQLVSQMSSLKQNDIVNLMRDAHTQQPTRFTHKNLAAILLTSENPDDLNQGAELFLSLNNPEPDIMQTVIHCLENQCRELQHNLGDLDYWLEESVKYGSPKAVKKLSDRLILDEKPTEALAWQEFHFALLKSGCYKSLNNYEQTYRTTKFKINELKSAMTEEQKQTALELANRRFEDYAAQSKRWLNCQ